MTDKPKYQEESAMTLRFTFEFTPANDKTPPEAWADFLRDLLVAPDAWPGLLGPINCEPVIPDEPRVGS